jgi:hypothetical protein
MSESRKARPSGCEAVKSQVNSSVIHLRKGKLLDIDDGQGLRVDVLDGVVWITQSYDPRDIVIEAHQSFVLDRPGLALVNSLMTDATIVITMARQVRRPKKTRGYVGAAPPIYRGAASTMSCHRGESKTSNDAYSRQECEVSSVAYARSTRAA